MILTISQYTEALTSPDGRIRTLEGLYPVRDETGAPVFAMPGHGLVDFEVMAHGKRYTLRCPLRCDGGALARLRALADRDRGLGGRFFAEWRVLEAEMVLFGADGKAFEIDILARPAYEGEKLADFLGRAVVRGDAGAVKRVAESFEDLILWAENVGRSGIALRKLLVEPDGDIRITGFSATGETDRIRGMLRAAGEKLPSQGTLFCRPEPKEDSASSGYGLDGGGKIRCVRDGGGWMYVDRRGKAVIDTVWQAAEPFRGDRAEVETSAGRGLIDMRGHRVLEPRYEEVVWDDYWGLAAVMSEGRWWLVDRDGTILTKERYDWIGECSEGFILAQKGGRCGFLDAAGSEVIPFVYDDASSFSEGCALVSLGADSFFIDARGCRI